jgi:ATP-dependent RNA helicase RhlE
LKTFSELELIEPLQRALVEENYHTPTPIQAQTIPAALDGCDILGCAQTGTGKTAAFALPILDYLGQENFKGRPNRPIVLVLAPTRELAIQIGESFETYGRHLRLRHVLVYGGVNQANQVRALSRGAHVLVATPGRLLDLMNQGYIHLDDLEIFVLDEADRMLDMGFLPDLKRIIAKLPADRQSMFFSATMPPNIVELSQRLLDDPVSVNVTPKSTSVERIEQQVLFVEKNGKQSLLQEVLKGPDVDSAIVFTRTKRGANMVAERLKNSGVKSAAIHGNKSQAARQRALEAFKTGNIRVLVATDLAARGIDVDGVTHVINFDLPNEPESYVHRIGRTGRAGASGMALSFCSSAEREDLRAIEKLIGKKVPFAPNQPAPQPATANRELSGSRAPRPGGGSFQHDNRAGYGSGSNGASQGTAAPLGNPTRTGSGRPATRNTRPVVSAKGSPKPDRPLPNGKPQRQPTTQPR